MHRPKRVLLAATGWFAGHPRLFFKYTVPLLQRGHRVWLWAKSTPPGLAPGLGQHFEAIDNGLISRGLRKRLKLTHQLSKLAQAFRPEVTILFSPELAPRSARARRGLGTFLYYDRMEDYPANVLHGPGYRSLLRKPLARLVMNLEERMGNAVTGMILAEERFQAFSEAIAPQKPTLLLPNLGHNLDSLQHVAPQTNPARTNAPYQAQKAALRLIVSGTLAEQWGTLAALRFAGNLSKQGPVELVVAGYAAQKNFREQLLQALNRLQSKNSRLTVEAVGITEPVAYLQQLQRIAAADLGLAFYQESEQFKNRVPSKFYEFKAAGTPLLYTPTNGFEAPAASLRVGHPIPTDQVFGREVLPATLYQDLKQLADRKPDATSIPPDRYLYTDRWATSLMEFIGC